MYGYWQTEMWFLSQEGKMHDQPKLVGYGNQLAWNCLLLACMKIEHFHHKNSFYSHSCAFRYKKYSIKIYRGSSKSICNLRYMLSITCVFYPQQIKTRCIIKNRKLKIIWICFFSLCKFSVIEESKIKSSCKWLPFYVNRKQIMQCK